MSKSRVAVLKVITKELTVTAAAAKYGYSRQHLHRLLARYEAGRMHHLGIGYRHRGIQILAIADDTTITVIELTTGEILSTHTIEPDKTCWRNTQRAPGRWPGAL